MKTTIYLYDIEPKLLANLPYQEALQLKYDSGKQLIATLFEPHYSQRDDERIHAVSKALKHTSQLLREL